MQYPRSSTVALRLRSMISLACAVLRFDLQCRARAAHDRIDPRFGGEESFWRARRCQTVRDLLVALTDRRAIIAPRPCDEPKHDQENDDLPDERGIDIHAY